jgi:uncharacterized protein (DUF2336 family)
MHTPPTSPEDRSELILTRLDVDRLLADASPASRISVLERVSNYYNNDSFKPRERDVAEQIFRLLMKDAVVAVRETLSDRIQHNATIPRDIILHIAEDIESVALPVIANSSVFSDADLVALVEASRELSKLLTISQRHNISPRVSDALVETSHPQVVSSLLSNETASISNRSFEKIVNDFRGEQSVMQTMIERKQLPIAVVERLVNEASTSIASQLKEKYQLTDAQMTGDATSARDDVLLYLLANHVDEEEMHTLIVRMEAEQRLTSSLIMTALCRGQLAFFTIAMATVAGVSVESTKRLLADKGDLGFRGIYEKSGFPESMLRASYLVLRGAQQLEHDAEVPGSRMYANRLVERVMREVGDENVQHLPYFIALIRQTIQRH